MCYDISKSVTMKREIEGLIEGMNRLSINKSILITAEEDFIEKVGKKDILIVPLWKWLLSNETMAIRS